MNSINITGFIATEPKQNTAGIIFLLAVHRTYRSKDEQTADFMPVSAFGKVADVITDYAHKGSKLGVTGSIKTSQYTGTDGQTHNGWEVVAREVFLLDSKPTTKPYKAKQYGTKARAKKASKPDPFANYVNTPMSDEDLRSLIAQMDNAND